jgi:hypothetical protein
VPGRCALESATGRLSDGPASRKPKSTAVPDIGSYSEDEWREARTLHAWHMMTTNLRARYAAERGQRLAALTVPKERERIENYYRKLEEPLLAESPPENWAEDVPEAIREAVVERPLGIRMVTPGELKQRELDEHARLTGQRYPYLSPGDGQPRPPGFGADEGVYVAAEEADE